MLAEAQKKKPETRAKDIEALFGASYRAMLEEVNVTLADLKKQFPEYKDQGCELAGFIWFQGWNGVHHFPRFPRTV